MRTVISISFETSSVRVAVRAAGPLRLSNQGKAEWVTRSVGGIGDLYSPDGAVNRQLRRSLYRDPSLADRGSRLLLSTYEAAAAEYPPGDPARTLTLLDKRFTSAEAMLAWSRAWPRAYGMDARLPYYDPDLIDIAMNVAGSATGKHLLRRLAEDSLPHQIAHAPKIAQQMPVGHWLRGPLRHSMRERLADLPLAMTADFDPTGVRRLADEHVAGRRDHGWPLVALLTIASWYDQLPR